MFAPLFVACALSLGAGMLGAVSWWGDTSRIRDAKGGPVKPATTRDYVFVTLYAIIALTAVVVGLWFMKK